MKSTTSAVSRCVGVVLFLASNFAWAEPSAPQPMSHASDGSLETLFYEFEDDALNALGHDAQGMLLRVRPGAARVVLLRPRVQFVSELLQSVEAL